MKTVPIFLYWTLRKSRLNVSWKLFQELKRRDSQRMTNMWRSDLISGPNPSQILYNDATYLCLARLRNGKQVRQVTKLPISRVTADSFPDCILLAKQEKEISMNFSSTKTVQVHLHFRVTARYVQDRNRSLSHASKSTQRWSVLWLMQLF